MSQIFYKVSTPSTPWTNGIIPFDRQIHCSGVRPVFQGEVLGFAYNVPSTLQTTQLVSNRRPVDQALEARKLESGIGHPSNNYWGVDSSQYYGQYTATHGLSELIQAMGDAWAWPKGRAPLLPWVGIFTSLGLKYGAQVYEYFSPYMGLALVTAYPASTGTITGRTPYSEAKVPGSQTETTFYLRSEAGVFSRYDGPFTDPTLAPADRGVIYPSDFVESDWYEPLVLTSANAVITRLNLSQLVTELAAAPYAYSEGWDSRADAGYWTAVETYPVAANIKGLTRLIAWMLGVGHPDITVLGPETDRPIVHYGYTALPVTPPAPRLVTSVLEDWAIALVESPGSSTSPIWLRGVRGTPSVTLVEAQAQMQQRLSDLMSAINRANAHGGSINPNTEFMHGYSIPASTNLTAMVDHEDWHLPMGFTTFLTPPALVTDTLRSFPPDVEPLEDAQITATSPQITRVANTIVFADGGITIHELDITQPGKLRQALILASTWHVGFDATSIITEADRGLTEEITSYLDDRESYLSGLTATELLFGVKDNIPKHWDPDDLGSAMMLANFRYRRESYLLLQKVVREPVYAS